jgi:hypothetical protein
MSLDRMLTASNVKTDDDGFIATGPIATEKGQLGAGLPVPMTFADPGSNSYTAAQAAARACTHLRVVVNESGVVISLDGGTTDSISLPPGAMDDIPVAIPAGTQIKVKRYTAGTAFTGLTLEVR